MDVDKAPRLELDDFRVRDPAGFAEARDLETGTFSQIPLQGNSESPPQLGGVPLPEHVAQIVVALPAQGLTNLPVVGCMSLTAPLGTAMRAHGAVTPRPARALVPDPMHGPERWGRERHEGAGSVRHRLGHALSPC